VVEITLLNSYLRTDAFVYLAGVEAVFTTGGTAGSGAFTTTEAAAFDAAAGTGDIVMVALIFVLVADFAAGAATDCFTGTFHPPAMIVDTPAGLIVVALAEDVTVLLVNAASEDMTLIG
jgi:hypothetical protein